MAAAPTNVNVAAAAAAGSGKTIEETIENILLSPEKFIGSIQRQRVDQWIYHKGRIVCRKIEYVPGLHTIFDHLLQYAADRTFDFLRVDIGENTVSVCLRGYSLLEDTEESPETIFETVLTKVKLSNIFSSNFVIETGDGSRKKIYIQEFTNNMRKSSLPTIFRFEEADYETTYHLSDFELNKWRNSKEWRISKQKWTKFKFTPDKKIFNMPELEDDVVALMKKRVIDMAGTLGPAVIVILNDLLVPVNNFLEYVSMYLDSKKPRVFHMSRHGWKICVSLSDGMSQQVSFVNKIPTIKGGTHVDYVANQISNIIMKIVNKKSKHVHVNAHTIKSRLWVFVDSVIDNPTFDSQTRDILTTPQSSFLSRCQLSDEFEKQVGKSGLVESLLQEAGFELSKDLKTDLVKKQMVSGIDELHIGHGASGRNSDKCTLILTVGSSAKSLAVAGSSVLGRKGYDVYTLKRELRNLWEASHEQIVESQIQRIMQIIAVDPKDGDSVRDKHLMITTNRDDDDGLHDIGLLIHFIYLYCPSLLEVRSFLQVLIIPGVKGVVGCSPLDEIEEYFTQIGYHGKDLLWSDQEDYDAIKVAFSEKEIEARKKKYFRQLKDLSILTSEFEEEKTEARKKNYSEQLEEFRKLTSEFQCTETEINYSVFVDQELKMSLREDLEQSIPSMVDGLKPVQRKILFCCFKENIEEKLEVAALCGFVYEHSAYHHEKASLASTIVGMAQNFVGSNNVNLLMPIGQFGSRRLGGKDHGNLNLYTRLSPVTRYLFPKDDDILLTYLKKYGRHIEPTWYAPVIPTVLVNGCEGVGTGWSTSIPNYNPMDIIANIKCLLNGERMKPMKPWYKGFTGNIESPPTRKGGGLSYTTKGIIEKINKTTLHITELPIRQWTQDYCKFLKSLEIGEATKKGFFIEDYKQLRGDYYVDFEVHLPATNLKVAEKEGLLEKFKLTTTVNTGNMILFDSKGILKKYDTPEEIIAEFFVTRLELYKERKRVAVENLTLELEKQKNQHKFLTALWNGDVIGDVHGYIKKEGFPELSNKTGGAQNYDYLLNMTFEMSHEELNIKKLEYKLDEMKYITVREMWMKDLAALENELCWHFGCWAFHPTSMEAEVWGQTVSSEVEEFAANYYFKLNGESSCSSQHKGKKRRLAANKQKLWET